MTHRGKISRGHKSKADLSRVISAGDFKFVTILYLSNFVLPDLMTSSEVAWGRNFFFCFFFCLSRGEVEGIEKRFTSSSNCYTNKIGMGSYELHIRRLGLPCALDRV